MRICFILLALIVVPLTAFAEGACPPGQYPIGGQGVVGCAPIPGAGASGSAPASRPTGKWETRWGAVADDTTTVAPGADIATGVAASQKTKRAAESLAMSRCTQGGGTACKVRLSYHNQCVALADPVGERVPGAITTANTAVTVDEAKSDALRICQSVKGQRCEVYYSACSMSEFKAF
ncbi:DUF4189 domain-containing protein [Stenotrophomonas sp. PD6]|uniref:DUF4189 domain-containing protein n=1 Tax=Stenotrophomonas sp. PD6 TaxID=3368612 RepID=UPI003B9FD38A